MGVADFTYEFFLRGARRAPLKKNHTQIKQCPFVVLVEAAPNLFTVSTLVAEGIMLIAKNCSIVSKPLCAFSHLS